MFRTSFLAKRQQPREFADQFDRQPPVFRDQPNGLNQAPQRFGGFCPERVLIQRVGQRPDLAAVDVGQTRMQQHGLVQLLLRLLEQSPLAGLKHQHLFLHRWHVEPVLDRLDQAAQLPLHLGEFTASGGLGQRLIAAQPIELAAVFLHELADQIGMQQIVLEAFKDRAFQLVPPNGQAVVAGSPIANVCASVVPLADENITAAADAAGQQPRQEVARPARILGTRCRSVADHRLAGDFLPRLHLRPKLFVDDPQRRDLLDNPLALRVRARLPSCGLRILDEALPVPDQSAHIEFVVEDAGAASPVAVDGRGAPRLSARSGDLAPVQLDRYRARAPAAGEVLENLPDDPGFRFFDGALARGRQTIRARLPDDPVAVGNPAGGAALSDPAFKPAPCLLCEVLKVECAHRALQPDVQFGDLAFSQSNQRNAVVRQLLEEARDMLLVTRQSIEAFRDDNIETAFARVLKQRLVAGPQMRGAADRMIGVDLSERPSLGFDALAANPHLILD